jgi:endonuclease III
VENDRNRGRITQNDYEYYSKRIQNDIDMMEFDLGRIQLDDFSRRELQLRREMISRIEQPIRSSYNHVKSNRIHVHNLFSSMDFSRIIAEDFSGNVPDNMEDLLTLPGVGRKIANLILGDIYKKPAIVADTHCIRISNRWGLCDSTDPKKVELSLKKLIPDEEQSDFCHRIVFFGREVCSARAPKCEECPFKEFKCKIK